MPDAFPYGPSPCNNHSLRRATRQISQLFDDVVAPSGLRATQHGMLAFVHGMNGPTMKELSKILVMDLSALGHTLKPLVRDGYVTLEPDERDRRSKRVKLTDAGYEKLTETTDLWQAAQARFEAVLGVEHAQKLRDVLEVVASADFARAFQDAVADERALQAEDAGAAGAPVARKTRVRLVTPT